VNRAHAPLITNNYKIIKRIYWPENTTKYNTIYR